MAPYLGGFLTWVALIRLGKELHLPKPANSASLVWIATPLLLYSLVLWEHTLAVGCGLMGLADLLHSLRKREIPFRAGLWLGAAALFRSEAALAGGILCLSVWYSRRRSFSFPSFITWGVAATFPPLLWGSLVSWLAVAPTTAQVGFPYLSPYSPWSGNEWGRHWTKILQTWVEPYQDASPAHLWAAGSLLILMLLGFFFPKPNPTWKRMGVIVILVVGALLVGVQLSTEKVFYAGILAACPALAAVGWIPKRPQTRGLIWTLLIVMILLSVIAPNNGGLQRGCRYLLLPCVLGAFLVLSEFFRMRGAARWAIGLVLSLGLLVQAQGIQVLWNHKSSKEKALANMLNEKPDFLLTSVWYFPQEAGRIYSEIPILWGRTDGQILQMIGHLETLQPTPQRFLAVLPSQSSDTKKIDLPRWTGERTLNFGSLPVFRIDRESGLPSK